jgi:small ligand-binding sensory domain FIST
MGARSASSGSAIGPAFRAAHATGPDWGQAASAALAALESGGLPDGANLGFLYVTDHLAGDLGSILTFLRSRTGIEDWVGSVGIGVIAAGSGEMRHAEHFNRPAVAVMVGALPAEAFRVFAPVSDGLGEFRSTHGGWIDFHKPTLGLVHADPRAPRTVDILTGLAECSGAYLVGGLTSSRTTFSQIADRVVEGGASGVLFGESVAVATGISQGCSPIGPARPITRAEDNVIAEIDGRPALDVLKEDMGELLSRDLKRALTYIHAALPIPGSDTGDYLVRNLVGIDPSRGLIGIGAEVAPGDPILFTRRDHDAAEADLKRMLAGLARRTAGSPIKGGVYVSCIARGPNLFGEDARELGLVAEALGEFPLVGFFANGEICRDRLYGYTGILTLFL